MSNGSRRLLLRLGGGAAAPSLQLLAGSCSQGETQAKEGRPSCLPLYLITLARRHMCPVRPLHCFPLPSRQVDGTTRGTRLSNRLARLAGDHASPVLETSPRPIWSTRPPGQVTSRLPQLQFPPRPLTPYDTWPSPLVTIAGPSVVETTACRGGGGKISSTTWTNDTRRDEDENRSPRAEATAARYEGRKPRAPGTSNLDQTRACFTAVQTKDSPACPPECPQCTLCRSTLLHHAHDARPRCCAHIFMYVM